MKPKNKRSRMIAISLVREVGSQTALAALIGIKQPSVSEWVKNGIGAVRENDLRFRFPDLQVWKRFPAKDAAKAKAR